MRRRFRWLWRWALALDLLSVARATMRKIPLLRTPDGLTVNLTIGARENVRFLLDIGSASRSWVLAEEATVIERDEETGLPIASFRTRHARVPATPEVNLTDAILTGAS